jgi:hypothetical protein
LQFASISLIRAICILFIKFIIFVRYLHITASYAI